MKGRRTGVTEKETESEKDYSPSSKTKRTLKTLKVNTKTLTYLKSGSKKDQNSERGCARLNINRKTLETFKPRFKSK